MVGPKRHFPRSRQNCTCAPGRGGQGRPLAARVAGRLDGREFGRAMIGAGRGKLLGKVERAWARAGGQISEPIRGPEIGSTGQPQEGQHSAAGFGGTRDRLPPTRGTL